MARSTSLFVALALPLIAACGEPVERAAPAPLLYVRTAEGLAWVGKDGTTEPLGDAVIAPGGATIVVAEPRGERTVVRHLGVDGRATGEVAVAGDLSPRVASHRGELVALAAPRAAGAAPYLPEGKTETRIVVLDDRGDGRVAREYLLEGNFEPEAFSTDGSRLFLIEFLPAAEPERYRVRQLGLADGEVEPIGRLKNAAPGQMQGTGRTQVYARDGGELYTLYTQQESAGHPEAGASHIEGEQAFVHLLNLHDGWAHCIDLPPAFGPGDATASAMALSPDGRDLHVVDWSNGAVALVRPRHLEVVRAAAVDFGAPDAETFAAASDDRLYVGGGSEVVVLDRASLGVEARWDLAREVLGLALAPDGSTLFVSLGSEVVALDGSTGEPTAALRAEGATAIELVADGTGFPFEDRTKERALDG